ncbi:hypothetical protein H7C19_32285 [Cohnella nanjingensis]|uniref:Cobyric acid synthase n=1 Tax=Cohnella nanjingensis TaxID=1387779 RepID=A0A7X0RX83_9BACL|nr:hypothetical protein [Cohnella nanjingensis]
MSALERAASTPPPDPRTLAAGGAGRVESVPSLERAAPTPAPQSHGRTASVFTPAPEALGRGLPLDIAVLRYPRIANFTDADPLASEPDVRLRYVTNAREWGEPDAVLLPGSKNTAEDLAFLRASGLEAKLLSYGERGGRIVGICGGYQMLGRRLLDPDGVESAVRETTGLGLLPTETTFAADKRTERVAGSAVGGFLGSGAEWPLAGYEIHMGRTTVGADRAAQPFRLRLEREPEGAAESHSDGAMSADGRVWGTYVHDIFRNDGLRRAWLDDIRGDKGLPPSDAVQSFAERRERAFDRLADHARRHLDMARIYRIIHKEAVSDDERDSD